MCTYMQHSINKYLINIHTDTHRHTHIYRKDDNTHIYRKDDNIQSTINRLVAFNIKEDSIQCKAIFFILERYIEKHAKMVTISHSV